MSEKAESQDPKDVSNELSILDRDTLAASSLDEAEQARDASGSVKNDNESETEETNNTEIGTPSQVETGDSNDKLLNGTAKSESETPVNGKKNKKKSKKAGKDKKEPVVKEEEVAPVVEEQQPPATNHEESNKEQNGDLEARLNQALEENQQLEDKYNRLLGKLSSIRTSLGDRLKQDAEELAEARGLIENLQEQNTHLEDQVSQLKNDNQALNTEKASLSRDFTSIRDRLNVAQQNWARERDEFENSESYLREEYETAKKAMQDWEVLAMEESSVKKALRDRCDDVEEQLAASKDLCQVLSTQRDKDYNTIEGLRQALEETQTARKAELREIVETTQSQIEALGSEKSELHKRLQDSEAQLLKSQQQVEQSSHFESEVKEKTLLIGKLRHEAVILNEHLTKALRMLKRGTQQDNVDRQLVTNLVLSFLALPRGDTKKYEALQLIASVLNWTDEQRESAGLARPGASASSTTPSTTGSMRSPSISSFLRARTPSNSGPESPNESKESLAELFTQFLDNEVKDDTLKPPP